jgi:L-seryl-tRNA(Ser) seleniumtransferase
MSSALESLYRRLPSTDDVMNRLVERDEFQVLPRPFLKDLVNDFLDALRREIREGAVSEPDQLDPGNLEPRLADFVLRRGRPHFRRVVNATGVVIHTNLGRSNLSEQAVEAVVEACRHYSNLEFDLETGKRGSRYSHVVDILCRVTGAEAGLVVNNNASAVVLVLDTIAKGREVVVSRGQLVEIGGSFRIPDVMKKSGAILREVGATNRTHPRDYEEAIGENTAALMKVHASNFRIIGFTREVSVPELKEIASRHGLPVFEDLGSGNFYDFSSVGMAYEPTVQETLAQGADIVTFSGDKVLGGPQAGVIVGNREFIEPIKKNPLNRALRIDKMTLAALEATLRLYLDPELARKSIPTLRMITADPAELKKKAQRLKRALTREFGDELGARLVPGVSRVGGGSFPERDLKTTLVALEPAGVGADRLRERLLSTDPPLVGRIEEDAFCLDPRTLEDEEIPLTVNILKQVL